VLDAPTGRVRESDEIQLAFNVKDACSTDACSGKGCHEVPGPVKVVGIPLVLPARHGDVAVAKFTQQKRVAPVGRLA
jgi:hypothetical protein